MYKVSSNPHVRSKASTAQIMRNVAIALLPAAVFGVFNFGFHALLLIAVTAASTVLSEYIFGRCMKKNITVADYSAVVTGLLLALNLPPEAPLWLGIIGGAFAIIVVKMLFGGLGQNFMNPALGARCFLLISFTSIMTSFDCDAYTGATPLAAIRAGESVDVLKMLIGRTSGTIGETSVIAILLGAAFLIAVRVIDLRVPLSYIISFAAFIVLFSGRGLDAEYIVSQLAGGGLMLGAFFMATDYVTRPITEKGQYIYGIFLGVMTGIFRLFGPSAEGVSYSIILGNLLVPLIENISKPAAFGKSKSGKGAAVK